MSRSSTSLTSELSLTPELYKARAQHPFTGLNEHELNLNSGDIVDVIMEDDPWALVRNSRNESGCVPLEYLKPVVPWPEPVAEPVEAALPPPRPIIKNPTNSIAKECAQCCCFFCLSLALMIFYAVALSESPEVSELSCGKVMWYTLCVTTGQGFASILILCVRMMNYLSDPDIDEEPLYDAICCWFVYAVSSFVNSSLLLEQVLNLSTDCRQQVEEYKLFWFAAQFQAYSWLGVLGLIALYFSCFIFCGIRQKISDWEKSG